MVFLFMKNTPLKNIVVCAGAEYMRTALGWDILFILSQYATAYNEFSHKQR